ncbi:MAG: long-chain fatty acid--CoA ligase [Bacteroidetes bacterium]|nr:long-chain fatty acid--CoA ligase [Bacteroidota bacterium]MBU1580322.1 long-chain fatty acid--CoA ligase [Bacteroidota bacterium]MBU2466064.1 long-chain fatty acid--CoA ligase [Bacteroidota bacterium]MBU2558233.1 long-chain fatty acid--CoA ligase [Bacteroidota bacterium]
MDKSITRIFDLLPFYEKQFKFKDDVLASKENGQWVKYDIKKFREIVDDISYALLQLGIKKGDNIATISNNCPEWNFIDMAILQTGAVHVPIYPTISESDYKFILQHAEVKFVFVAGKELYSKIEHLLPELAIVPEVYTFKNTEGVKHLSELIQLGATHRNMKMLEYAKAAIQADEIATLIYTSGTTGNPKGVMLSHHNLLSNVDAVHTYFPVDESCRALSYLPLCHVYERTNIYTYLYLGVSIYYAENMGTIADNIREISPQILTTVPRLLEKVYDKIIAKGLKLKGAQKQIFFWAVNLGLNYKEAGKNSIFYKAQLAVANKLVFKKWREALGGEMRVIVSGGAALQPRLIKVFTAGQIPVLEGYGLTETSPVIAVNTLEKGGLKFGTVGKVLKNVEVKIAQEGEILVKGPNVMKGYFKNQEMTAEAIDQEGWFHTGDVGHIEPSGHLRITGRIKEIFKTSMGKYISPALIENRFKESPFIDGIMVIGEHQKFAAALIVPNFEHLRSWCRIKDITYTSDKEMIQNNNIVKRLRKEIDHYNSFFGDYEKIKKFELTDHEWTVPSGELTANLKLKRSFITLKYKDKIDKIYSD